MLVTGYSLANAPVVARALGRVASIPKTPKSAISLTVFVAMLACWLNWGLGLVVSALLAREIAKRVRIDFGWLVAAAYSGFVISTEGLSGSIALSQATHGSELNIVEKVTGQLIPLSQTVFTSFNLIPILVLFVILPIVFRYLGPPAALVHVADPERLRTEDQQQNGKEKTDSIGSKLDHAWILNVLLVLFGSAALAVEWLRTGFSLDLNSVIMVLLLAGLLLHRTPAAYVVAVQRAARITGSLILQYPLYGGLMGIMTGTGLAGVLA
jgi:short-chain fatty acids transporter